MPPLLDAAVATGLAGVRARIERAGGDPELVRVLAVTKGFGPEAINAARSAGLVEVGENYARELATKRASLEEGGQGAGVRWHFLGVLQQNKIGGLAPLVDCWQSVSRPAEGERIARASPGATVLIQVAGAPSAGRPGCRPEEVPALARALLGSGLDLVGLMAVAPRPAEEARDLFRTVANLADRLGLPVRSIGMTEDLELAVAEGSTMVRIGRALFGDRPPPAPGRPAPGMAR